MMARTFTLTQIHQRIDERLRIELRKRRPNPLEISRLELMKLRAKSALRRLMARPVSA